LAAERIDVDVITRAFWEQSFELSYRGSHASAFQDFFHSIMGRRYPGDFQPVVPWGQVGDLKNDGYLGSQRKVFQCYGPKTMAVPTTLAKIESDFSGAILHWTAHFEEWVFVHNQRDGLPPQVVRRLLELTGANPYHPARSWGYPELRDEAMRLPAGELAALFGDAPTVRTMLHLGFDDIQPLINTISHRDPPIPSAVLPVPAEKLQANMLSDSVRALIEAGFTRTRLVGEYFAKHHDPLYEDRIAAWFREQYVSLRVANTPDDTYDRLRDLVGGVGPANASRQSAVLAILAYFFETCDIFEPHASQADAATN
jgi:hypothetical protein